MLTWTTIRFAALRRLSQDELRLRWMAIAEARWCLFGVASAINNVRCYPESGHLAAGLQCPLSAIRDQVRRSKRLFDYAYCALRPAALKSGGHFFSSPARNDPNSSGDVSFDS